MRRIASQLTPQILPGFKRLLTHFLKVNLAWLDQVIATASYYAVVFLFYMFYTFYVHIILSTTQHVRDL